MYMVCLGILLIVFFQTLFWFDFRGLSNNPTNTKESSTIEIEDLTSVLIFY